MNFLESKAFERICWIVMIIATVYFSVMLTLAYQEGPTIRVPQLSPAEKIEIGKLHKKHGISSSVLCGVTGERYFIRDGVKCRI